MSTFNNNSVSSVGFDTAFAAGARDVDMYRAMLVDQCNASSFEERQEQLRRIQNSLALKPEEVEYDDDSFFFEADDCGDCVMFS